MTNQLKKFGALGVAAALGIGGAVVASPDRAEAMSDDVMINEIYAGGGTIAGPFHNDYVELHNSATQPIDLSGYEVVSYMMAVSTVDRIELPADTVVQPGELFVIADDSEWVGDYSETPVPNVDVEGELTLATARGAVALIDPDGNVVDTVGYGAVPENRYEHVETEPAQRSMTNEAIQRGKLGVDTDNNRIDFMPVAPTPGTHTETGALNAFVFDDATLNNEYDEGDTVRTDGIAYLQDERGVWYGTPQTDGQYSIPSLAPGTYDVYLPTGNSHATAVYFDATTSERLPQQAPEQTPDAYYFDPEDGWMTFTVSATNMAVATVEIPESGETNLAVGTSSIEAWAEIVDAEGNRADDLATVEFIDGDTVYETFAATERFGARDANGDTAYFLAPQVELAVTPVEGYDVTVTATASSNELNVTETEAGTYAVDRADLPNSFAHVDFVVQVTQTPTETPTPTPTETEAPVAPTLNLGADTLTQPESVDGLPYEGRGFDGAESVRIELEDAAGNVTVIEEAATVTDGAFNGVIVYQTADDVALEMPVGAYTVRATAEIDGEDVVVEANFEVVAEAGVTPAPTETPGETIPTTPGDDGDFVTDDHEGGLAQTGADNGLVLALAIGAVLVLAGAGVMVQRRRA